MKVTGTAARNPRSEAAIDGTGTTAFGKYQLFASLGRGGMADVYLSVARGQMGFNKLAVIKRLRPALAEEVAFRNMFLDEARLAARLSHPNIVHTYEVGQQGGAYFIAMEYLEGQSLNKVLKELSRRKERLDPVTAVRIVADALAGLGYSHELRDYDGSPLGIIHRDVSPHNIFVTYDGHTKVVDFGIAKAATSSTETEVGVLKGKVAYMSPEQAMGKTIDARSDLFAMGIVLWELLAQQRLMTGDSAANTLHKLMNEPIPRISQAVPGIDPELDHLVAIALEKDPARRHQSAAEMRGALEHWLSAHGPHVRQEQVSHTMVGLFGSIREEVQRQVQRHMAMITAAANTQELQALTAESLARMNEGGAGGSAQLLRLGTSGSGSGSGIIANYGGLSSTSGFGSLPPGSSNISSGGHPQPFGPPPQVLPQEPQRSSSALLIVITIGCFVLAGLLILVIGLRDRGLKSKPELVAEGEPTAATATPTGARSGDLPAASDPPTAPLPNVIPSTTSPVATGTGKVGHVHAPTNPTRCRPATSGTWARMARP